PGGSTRRGWRIARRRRTCAPSQASLSFAALVSIRSGTAEPLTGFATARCRRTVRAETPTLAAMVAAVASGYRARTLAICPAAVVRAVLRDRAGDSVVVTVAGSDARAGSA